MTRYSVPDMSCGHCRAAITEALSAEDAGVKLDFEPEARVVGVTSALPQPAVLKALEAAGYSATPL